MVRRVNAVLVKVINTPEMKASFTKQGVDAQTSTPEHFAEFIHSEIAQSARLIKLSGAKTE